MRTRMYGGVRGRGLAAPSYSIEDCSMNKQFILHRTKVSQTLTEYFPTMILV